MVQEPAPNTSSVWIQVVQTVGTLGAIVISHWLANRKADRVATTVKADVQEVKTINTEQSKQLEAVHAMVNGDRLAKTIRIAELETKVRSMGGEP